MAKSTESSPAAIDSLLEERAQYEAWLSKLAASNAPEAVREKVRGDYEARLSRVIDSLRAHADGVAAELERFRGSLADLEQRETRATETMAEAELRHSVGEYDSKKWDEVSRSQRASLDGVRKELARVRAEIERLTEVQSLIEGDAEDDASPLVEAPPAAKAKPASSTPSPEAAGSDDRGKAGLPGDELDFLKSVTLDASRRSAPRSEKVEPVSSPAKPTPPPVAEPPASPAPAAPAAAAPNEPAAESQATSSKPLGATAQAKTLKCNECGTLNRPTEWYCERCGAELAAL